MPFPQHLDRTARVSEEKKHPAPSMLANLQTLQRHWPTIMRFKPRPKKVTTKCDTSWAHAELPTKHSELLNKGKTGWKVGTTSKHSFLANHFRYYLTLFSKFFSPFLHSTCSLSVNRRYLVLDGVYHPLRAAIPSNPTRREHIIIETYIYKRPWTGLSPSLMPRSCGLMPPKFQMLLR